MKIKKKKKTTVKKKAFLSHVSGKELVFRTYKELTKLNSKNKKKKMKNPIRNV